MTNVQCSNTILDVPPHTTALTLSYALALSAHQKLITVYFVNKYYFFVKIET